MAVGGQWRLGCPRFIPDHLPSPSSVPNRRTQPFLADGAGRTGDSSPLCLLSGPAGSLQGVSGHRANFAMLQQASNSWMDLLLQEVCFLTLTSMPSQRRDRLAPA